MFTFTAPVKESTTDIPAYEGHVEPTLEGMQDILFEGSREYTETSAALYVADVMVETSVKEGADMEILIEGVVKDSFLRIKAVFQKMWAKVKAWFASVKKLFQQLTLKGKEFIKQFKSELNEKARTAKGKGFKYKGYHLTIEAGEKEAKRIAGILAGYIATNADNVATAAEQLADAQQGPQPKVEVDEQIEKMWAELKVDNAAELAELVRVAHHNGEESKEVIEDFEANSVQELMSIVEHSDAKIKEMDKMEKQVSAGFAKIIKALQTAESKAARLEGKADENASAGAAAVTALVTARLRVSKAAIAAYNTVAAANASETRAAIAQAQSTLRSLLSFKVKKAVKESYTEDLSEDSILESAMRML